MILSWLYHLLFALCCDITFDPLTPFQETATFINLEVSCQNCVTSGSKTLFRLMCQCSENSIALYKCKMLFLLLTVSIPICFIHVNLACKHSVYIY